MVLPPFCRRVARLMPLGAPAKKKLSTSYFSATREIYRTTAESFEYADISELYRTPVELGWKKSVKFDHNIIGRNAPDGPLSWRWRDIPQHSYHPISWRRDPWLPSRAPFVWRLRNPRCFD